MTTILLLTLSNIFMTFAWYGHLKYPNTSMVTAILVSWGIALFEYSLMVPANRLGYGKFSLVELKTMQEAITLIVFCVFSVVVMKEGLKWNYFVGFALIVLAVWVIFKKW